MLLPLVGGSYYARSPIGSSLRCINYYPEGNPKSSLSPTTHYQRPGLRPLTTIGTGPVRGIYRDSRSNGWVVSGNQFFQLNPDFTATPLGTITPGRTNPVSMIDNGIEGLLVDGSTGGWTWQVGSGTSPNFQSFVDSSGLFAGADRVDTIDTFVIWNMPGTQLFGSTLSNELTIDPTYFAGKSDYPDILQTLIVNRHEFLLVGSLKSEAWYDAGNALFPFAELPGAYIEHGTTAKYSVASQDISVYWLSQNLQGQGLVLRYRGYTTTRISNHAIEYAIRQMALTVGVSDAIGYCYQLDGHVFYVLHFPAGNQTWVFDESIGNPIDAWHQEAWTDSNGQLNRHRGNCHAFLYGRNVVGDWQNGTIYEMDHNYYNDEVGGSVGPITCIRTFPQIGAGQLPNGQLVEYEGRHMVVKAFRADFEGGIVPENQNLISLRLSIDRGRTFGDPELQTTGRAGEFEAQPIWRSFGSIRYPVFELSHSIAGPAALNGAWVETDMAGS